MSIKNWNAEGCSVYSITNIENGMRYIGVAKNPEARFKEHRRPRAKYISYINSDMMKRLWAERKAKEVQS